jgi:hypothetical protein
LACRALSFYNLVIFFGVFIVQWGIGIIVDIIKLFGHNEILAFQGAFLIFFICCTGAYIYFLIHKSDRIKEVRVNIKKKYTHRFKLIILGPHNSFVY